MDKYQVIKTLGEGTFGVVVKCVNKETNEVVAIKRMKDKINWEAATRLREVKALKKLNNHDNIVKIREMTLKQDILNIVFEFCDLNLYQEITSRAGKKAQFTNEEIRNIMFQCLTAIEYVHRNGYAHRDIKPENFLVKHIGGVADKTK